MTDARKPSLVHAPLLILIVACQFALTRADSPVVIWCHNDSYYDSQFKTTRSNPLVKLSSEDFEKSLLQLSVTDPTAIVAEELCVEDLKNNKALSLAANGSKIHYFPHVVMPDVVFQKVFSAGQIKAIEDVTDDHDLNMILKNTDSSGCVALTGKQCRYYAVRIKRDTMETEDAEDDKDEEFKLRTDRVLFYSAKPLLYESENTKKSVKLLQSKMTGSSTRMENRTLILYIKFAGVEEIGDLELEFVFPVKSAGYYTFEKINSREKDKLFKLFAKRDIYFPYNFSYHCSLESAFVSKDVVMSLNITDMQVEIDHKKAVFSDAYDCVGFTSIPIWTAIFVSTLLISILIWALVMIMDINTMDRFDDPKGKTITISTVE